jgi:hypothetical protein
MGRYINCQINGEWKIVWKYGFGKQSSEMSRIYEELGVGEYHPVHIAYVEGSKGRVRTYAYVESRVGADADILILRKKDIEDLGEWAEVLKEICKSDREKWFAAMVEAVYQFIIFHSDCEELVLEGEF